MASQVEAALGLRVRAGSREALLRAAFDLMDTQAGFEVRRRSLVWAVPSGVPGAVDELAAGLAVTAQVDIPGIERVVERLQQRLSAPQLSPLVIDLLWAHDPDGVPDVVAVPPMGPNEPKRPPMPGGRMLLHPDVLLRASACGPLAEVAELARDPATTRFASESLATVPPPFLERPQPFTPAFALERRAYVGGRVDAIVTEGRADLLAAAAEAFCGAPKAAQPIGAMTLVPSAAADTHVEIDLPRDVSLRDRIERWLLAVEQAVVSNQLAVRRVVVIEDGPLSIHGILFGARRDVAPKLGRLRDLSAREDPSTGEFAAEIAVLDP